jgi:hypothetical protein
MQVSSQASQNDQADISELISATVKHSSPALESQADSGQVNDSLKCCAAVSRRRYRSWFCNERCHIASGDISHIIPTTSDFR